MITINKQVLNSLQAIKRIYGDDTLSVLYEALVKKQTLNVISINGVNYASMEELANDFAIPIDSLRESINRSTKRGFKEAVQDGLQRAIRQGADYGALTLIEPIGGSKKNKFLCVCGSYSVLYKTDAIKAKRCNRCIQSATALLSTCKTDKDKQDSPELMHLWETDYNYQKRVLDSYAFVPSRGIKINQKLYTTDQVKQWKQYRRKVAYAHGIELDNGSLHRIAPSVLFRLIDKGAPILAYTMEQLREVATSHETSVSSMIHHYLVMRDALDKPYRPINYK